MNVEHMINKSRGGYAYTMIDLDKEMNPDDVKDIAAMENVLRIRVI